MKENRRNGNRNGNEKIVGALLLAMTVVLTSVFVFVSVAAAAAPWEGYLVPQDSTGNYGEDTVVGLWVTYDDTGLPYGPVAYQVDVHFEPSCVNVTAADFSTSPFTAHMFTPYASGVVRILEDNYATMTPISSGTYKMATLTLHGCSASCTCDIWFDTNVVSDTDGNPITNTYTNGTYTAPATPPNITSWNPVEAIVNDTEGTARTFNITVNQTVNVSWQINGAEVLNQTDVTESEYTNTSATVGTWNVSAIASNENGTAMQTWLWIVQARDTNPPGSITNLTNVTGNFWINWTWMNPADADFNHTMVYMNRTWQANTSYPFYNATALDPDTCYEIGTRTVDTSGNINETWVNQMAKTQAENIPPLASFFSSPEPPFYAYQTITFNASSSYDPDGVITNYEWHFGDGNITKTTEEVIKHLYSSAGNYTVNLTVTDDDGAKNTTAIELALAIKGDLNGDGVVTMDDVHLVAGMVIGTVKEDLKADFNGNGYVDVGDAAKLLGYVKGKVGSL